MSRESGIQTVLASTDFSTTAAAGVEWAAEIARSHQARVVLVHALAPPIPPAASPDFVAMPPDFHRQYREAALQKLDATAASLRARGIETVTELEVGPAAPTVIELAAKHSADLIVIGTRGLTGFRHLLLGSTAQHVVQKARCPVLAVHPDDAEKHRAVRTILVPTDFSEGNESVLRVAGNILRPEKDARLILLHAYHLPVEFTALGTVPMTPRLYADAAEQARAKLEELAAPLRALGIRVETLAREGYPPTVIEEEARAQQVDLIAMGTHGRSGLRHLLLGSTAERVVQHAPCPVLTLRRADA
jgi:nucleotide-binding universal stress UspA family protein